ncbi:MAG: TetR/AcrR family transcriptional regulator [Clostridia bacterium]
MSNADKTIGPKILDCAKAEFLERGFVNASLRRICANAGVTTGALYKRYSGKEALFQALVQDVVDDIDRVVADRSIDYTDPALSDTQLYNMWTLTEDYLDWWFDFLLIGKTDLPLLLKCAEGTQYQNFQHDLVERICKETYKCYPRSCGTGAGQEGYFLRELHVLTTAFWSTMYEPFIHDFTNEETRLHCYLTTQFIDWHKVLEFREPQA